MEERFTEIERENRILLEKMTSIMKFGGRHPAGSGGPPPAIQRPATTNGLPKSLCKLKLGVQSIYSSTSAYEEP
jgi:Hemingway/CFA97